MIFNKYLLIGIGVLCLALAGSGWYIKTLVEDKAVLKESIKEKNNQIERLSETLKTQRERYEETLAILNRKESEVKSVEKSNNDLRRKLKEIVKNEEDECLNTSPPQSITDVLRIVPN